MRVLLISASYTNSSGGVATHVINLASGLVNYSRRIHVHVITLRKPGGNFKKDCKGNLTEWKFDRREVPEFNGRRLLLERIVRTIMENWFEVRPDVMHAHDLDALQIGCMLKAAFGKPLVMTVHRAPTEWRRRRYRENPKDCYMEMLRQQQVIDAVVVPSDASRRVLSDQGFSDVRVIPHGVSKYLLSFESVPSLLQRLEIPDSAKLIFCPVRADEHKDPEVFVRAAAIVKESLPDEKLVFLLTSDWEGGETEGYSAELRSIAQVWGLREGKDIHFTPPFEFGKELATVYRHASVVVIPSIRESFGQTVIDAFMFGRPIVARNSMALAEIVEHGVSGLLFSTAEELAMHIRRVLLDKNLAGTIVAGGLREFRARYSVRQMVEAYVRLYQEIRASYDQKRAP